GMGKEAPFRRDDGHAFAARGVAGKRREHPGGRHYAGADVLKELASCFHVTNLPIGVLDAGSGSEARSSVEAKRSFADDFANGFSWRWGFTLAEFRSQFSGIAWPASGEHGGDGVIIRDGK